MKRQSGFTLIETVVFIVVVSVALAGLASLFSTNIQNSAAPLIRERSIMLAQAYMDEIISKKWNETTPLGGGCIITELSGTNPDMCTDYCASMTNAAQCDRSKCNYNTGTSTCEPAASVTLPPGVDGVSEINNRSIWNDIDDFNGYSVSPPTDIDGNNIANYAGFTVSVAVTVPGSDWNGIPARDVRRITVSVTNTLGETITLTDYRVNF